MRDEVELARKAFAYWPFDEVNKITGRRRHGVLNNAESVAARISACNEAAASAEALRLAPDQAAVPMALATLRAALPAVADVAVGIPTPKPEPKPKIGGLAAMRERSSPPADGTTPKENDAH